MMITGVIETFAICSLYRFHWLWFLLYYIELLCNSLCTTGVELRWVTDPG